MHTSYPQRKIFDISKFMLSFVNKKNVSKLCLYCQFALFQVKLFFVTMVLDMQIQNLIQFYSIQLIQTLTYFRSKVKLSLSTMVLGSTIQNFIYLNKIEIKSVHFKSIQINSNQSKSIQFNSIRINSIICFSTLFYFI